MRTLLVLLVLLAGSGEVFAERVYTKDGTPFTGLHRDYHDNGQLAGEATFKDGKPEGLLRSWDDNGQLKFEGTYKGGKP